MSLVSSYSAANGESDEEHDAKESLSGNISDEEEHHSPSAVRKRPAEEVYSPIVKDSDGSDRQLQKKSSRLVSYGDADDDDEDDEADSDSESVHQGEEAMEDETRIPDTAEALLSHEMTLNADLASSLSRSVQNVAADDITLPPEPPGRCSKHLQEKITKMYQKVKYGGMDMNDSIQKKKEFRNPSIYEKLIEYISIDEKGTNYPPDVYDPRLFGKESFYEELARIQKTEMDKREKERKDKTKVEFVTATKVSAILTDADKRKSKWDVALAAAAAGSSMAASVVASSASGTKSTVIPAGGSLTKKK